MAKWTLMMRSLLGISSNVIKHHFSPVGFINFESHLHLLEITHLKQAALKLSLQYDCGL